MKSKLKKTEIETDNDDDDDDDYFFCDQKKH